MTSLSSLLNAMSITAQTVHHGPTDSQSAWKEALARCSGAPDHYELTKTLVYKPKAAKTAAPVPVIAIMRDNAESMSGALGKKLDMKDLRLANDELLKEIFQADKTSISPLSLNPTSFPRAVTVLDSSLANSGSLFAVRALSSEATVFLQGTEIAKYLDTLQTADQKVQVVDLGALKQEISAGRPPDSASTAKPAAPAADAKIEGAAQIAVGIKKDVDFASWYTNVVIKGEMIDYYSVSGCYILRPWAYAIWDAIQDWFNPKIKALGVQNCYFPMFVSSKVLEKEKDHIEGFAPEVAWVTKAGSSDLEEPIAIRPTSETVMYPYYAKWIQSHRDLPLKLNQWNSVVRWEFKNPQPFLRTREFLWQEGHTAHMNKADADSEVLEILELYRRIYTDLLAVPVIPGAKSEKEKFAGGLYTTTVEGFIPSSGRGIQGATSHCLGQNFSKMFNIVVEDPTAAGGGAPSEKLHVWQNSWGLSTRTIGVMVMVHGDDKGLVLPPRVASVQVIVIPCGITAKTLDTDRSAVTAGCQNLVERLSKIGVKARGDYREGYTPGYKFNDWELKGVPVRLEIGPADLQRKQTLSVRRDTGVKTPIPLENVETAVLALLDQIHQDMYDKAKRVYDSRLKTVLRWNDVVPALDAKCVVVMPWCEVEACEDDIKERSAKSAEQTDERAPSAGAKSLCIPFDQERWGELIPGKTKCTACGRDAKRWTLFGRSY